MKLYLAGALMLTVTAAPAVAGDVPLYQPAPAWVVPSPPLDAAALTAGPPIVVLDQQIRFEKAQVSTYSDAVIRIDTPEMLTQLGLLNGAWMPDKGDFIVHRAQILRGNDVIDLLDTDKFEVLRREAQLEQRVLSGLLTATMAIKGLRLGDAIRLSVTVTSSDAALGGKAQNSTAIPRDEAALGFGRILVSWPEGEPVKWQAGPRVTVPANALRTSAGWTVLTVPVGKADIAIPTDAPPRYRQPAMIQATTFAGWADIARTMGPLFATDGLIAEGSPLSGEVSAIKVAHPDQLGRAAAALQLVQGKVSYLLMGMNGGNYVPQPPARTWELRYGDCKAKSLLLLAMLRDMGIEAEAVLASTTAGDALPELLPLPGDFDHVIVRAMIDGRELWLDGTRSGARLEDIGEVPRFGYVLPLRSEGAELLPIAWHPPARPAMTATIALDATAGVDLPMPFDAAIDLRGDIGSMLHLAEGQMGRQKREEMISGIVRTYLPDAQIGKATVRWDDAAGTATIAAKGVTWPDWTFDRTGAHLPLSFGREDLTFAPDRARAAWKAIPVATQAPAATAVAVTLRLPDGGTGYAIEGDGTFEGTVAGANVARQTALTGATLSLTERIDLTGAEIAPEVISAEKARAAQVAARLPKLAAPVTVQRYWEIPARDGRERFAALEAAYGAVIASDPKSAIALSYRGRFREVSGDLKGALADYDRAIMLEPSGWLYRTRSSLRSGLGQVEGALADMAAASEIDPSDQYVASEQALLLSRAGRPDDAVALLEDRIGNGGEDNAVLTVALAEVLSRAGRADEALARLDSELKAKPGNPALLNGRCWTRGTMNREVDTALRECTKAIELADDPAPALDSRALVYFRLNRLEEAEADVDAALAASPGQAGSLFLRGIIRQQRGLPGAFESLAAARRIEPDIEERYRLYGLAPSR